MHHPPRDRKDHYVPRGYLRGFIDPVRASHDRPLWCLSKVHNQWQRKSVSEICHIRGMYDFSNDAIVAEHADMTFKSFEDLYPPLLQKLSVGGFSQWRRHLAFLAQYMDMIRVRSPQFFVQKGQEVAESFVGRVLSVDHARNAITLDSNLPLDDYEVHDFTLTKMREEFYARSGWTEGFHWQVRTVSDPYNPIVASDAPLFVSSDIPVYGRSLPTEILSHPSTIIYFPLCWQACLVGTHEPAGEDVADFKQTDLLNLRHMASELAPEYVISPQIVEGLVLDSLQTPSVKTKR